MRSSLIKSNILCRFKKKPRQNRLASWSIFRAVLLQEKEQRRLLLSVLGWWACLLILSFITWWAFAVPPRSDEAINEEVRLISKQLRCAVCQSESVWESNAELAAQMRSIVRERVIAGESRQAILDYFVSRYGDFILLEPRVKGLNTLLWFGPFLMLSGVGIYLAWQMRRWVRQSPLPSQEAEAPINENDRKRIEEALKPYKSGEV